MKALKKPLLIGSATAKCWLATANCAQPNTETAKAIQDARENKNLIAYKNTNDLFKKLGL